MKQIYLQQGDVILSRVTEIPKDAKLVKLTKNSFVLEKGEGTNTHELRHPRLASVLQLFETKEEYFIKPKASLELVHQEHGTSQIEEGIILSKVKEREWDYETEEARAVMD